MKDGNEYILLGAVDHYLKWAEAKAMADQGGLTITKTLESEVICRLVECPNKFRLTMIIRMVI
jgi:hypothetical protein